jgi:hypothetical protein
MVSEGMADTLSAELAIYNYAMDSETAQALHQVSAIIGLTAESVSGIGDDEPTPEAVLPALRAVQGILRSAMERAGAV